MIDVILVLLVILFVGFSGFFSGSEIAFATANKIRLQQKAESGNKTAKIAKYIQDNYSISIATILAGNNLVNIAAASTMTVLVSHFATNAETLSTIILTIIVLIFGEIFPKVIFNELADKMVLAVAWPLRIIMVIFFPVVWLVTKLVEKISPIWTPKEKTPEVTEEELVTILDTIEDEGVFSEKESELIKSAIEFHELTAKDVLIPRVDVYAFDIEDDLKDLIKNKDIMSFSRFPVYEGSIDNIIGTLSTKRLVKEYLVNKDIRVRDLLSPPLFVHMTKDLNSILKDFKRNRTHMAIVVDEFGGMMGILTLEDVVEQIVGDIFDESDEVEKDFVKISDNLFSVDGGLPVEEMFDEIGYTPEDFDSEYTTVGGWATEQLDKFPEVGDSFVYDRYSVKVTRAQAMRVERLTVELLPPEEDEDQSRFANLFNRDNEDD